MVGASSRSLFLGLAGLALLGATPADARPLEDVVKAGSLRIGVFADSPPLGFRNDNKDLVGFEVELGARLAEMMGVKPEFVPINDTERIPAVTTGRVDVSFGGLIRTPQRAILVDYTAPIFSEAMAVLTVRSKPFRHPRDLNTDKITLAQVRGTSPVSYIQKNLPKAKLVLFDQVADVVRAVAQGRADAAIENTLAFAPLLKDHKTDWRILDDSIETNYAAAAVSKNSDSLRRWLNLAIYELHRDGFIANTWRKYYGGDMIFPIKFDPFF